MLTPIIKATGITRDALSLTLSDQTGAYNVTTNPGGYGIPNTLTPPAAVGFKFRNWNQTENYLNTVINTPSIITELLTTGRKFDTTLLGLAPFRSGVHLIKYYVFDNVSTIVSLTQGAKVIVSTSGAAPNTFNAAYKAVVILNAAGTIVSNVLMLDPTVTSTATTFAITTPWNLASATGYSIKLATEGDLKIILTQLADKCITQAIGKLSTDKSCTQEDVDTLSRLLMWKFSAQVKFDCKDYDGADAMISAAYDECTACLTNTCKTC